MKNTSKILALVLVLMMVFAMTTVITASAVKTTAPTTLYLTPNANWKSDGARFAIYTWDGGDKWFNMTDADGDGTYECEIPSGIENIIFCRMNPNNSANGWSTCWNQTSDLKYNGSSDHYTVAEGAWSKGAGTWSTFNSTCEHANLGPAATCTTAQVCNDCGDPVVSALGHTYNSAHLCTRCNTQATFVIAGDGAHLGGDFKPELTVNNMTYDPETGVYTKVYTNVAVGSYKFKCVRDNDTGWGTAYPAQDKTYSVATAGSTVTITLKGTTVTVTVEAPHVCNFVAGETVAPTYTAEGYTVYTCTCGKTENRDVVPALEVKMPAAVVTPLEGTDLTFALTFTIEDLEAILADPAYCEALLAKYGSWYVDYRLTISGLTAESVKFNANGNADGYLAGRYNNWEDNMWVKVPDASLHSSFADDLVINNGESVLVMKYAADKSGISGLRQTFEDIAKNVVIFDCGIYFTPEFLHANPGMKVTLELIVFNGAEETLVDDAEFEVTHTVTDATCTAPMVCTCGYTEGEALAHAWNQETWVCETCGKFYCEVTGVHTYLPGYPSCVVCWVVPNPEFENNFTTAGENTLVCNKWHLVENAGGHGKPYQFTFMTIPEDGFYIFTTTSNLSVFIYTLPYDQNDPNWVTGGTNWNYVTFNMAELKAGVYYLGFVFGDGEGEYDLTITKHDHTEEVVAGKDATCTEAGLTEGKKCSVCGTVLVKQEEIPATGHEYVDGVCHCGAEEPKVEPPVEEPKAEELNFFQKIIAWIVELFNKFIALFKKN